MEVDARPAPAWLASKSRCPPASWWTRSTILEIKSERIADPGKLANVRRELAGLSAIVDPMLAANAALAPLKSSLRAINETLWQIEDDIRDCERDKDFGPKFVELARNVYRTNDQRAAREAQDRRAARLGDQGREVVPGLRLSGSRIDCRHSSTARSTGSTGIASIVSPPNSCARTMMPRRRERRPARRIGRAEQRDQRRSDRAQQMADAAVVGDRRGQPVA